MCGIIAPGSPRVIHRSHNVTSSGPSNGPPPNVLPVRRLMLKTPLIPESSEGSAGPRRRSASGVMGGILPSGGSTISHARLPLLTSNVSRN